MVKYIFMPCALYVIALFPQSAPESLQQSPPTTNTVELDSEPPQYHTLLAINPEHMDYGICMLS